MALTPTSTSNSDAANLNQVNNIITTVNNMEKVQIFKDDTGTRRVLLGKGLNGFYGLKVSKEGFDVYEAGDDDLVFNSNNNVFKIVSTGTATVTTTGAGLFTTEIAHGLSFVPICIGFAIYPDAPADTWGMMPYSVTTAASGADTAIVTVAIAFATVDATNLKLNVNQIDSPGVLNGDWRFKYYLLQETAN